jgi:dihydrofolate reductase
MENTMGETIWHVTMSLDGFIAGPDDEMDWLSTKWDTATTVDDERPNPIADQVIGSTGAILAGRHWYEVASERYNGVDGIYGGKWTGPVLVLTHAAPQGTHHPAVTFVSDGVEAAVAAARDAAQGKDVVLFGADIPRQCLEAGLLDEIVIHLAPVLLGDGTRFLAASGIEPVRLLRTTASVSGPVTDLRFQVVR